MDNILVYHLPFRQTDNQNTLCEFHSKKIRKRKVVGNVGKLQFDYLPLKRRFIIGGRDYIEDVINSTGVKSEFSHSHIIPNKNFYEPNEINNFESIDMPF